MKQAAGQERIANTLLAAAAISATGLLICAVGWYRAATSRVDLSDLSPGERLTLVEELVERNPGVHRPAWFEPAIGYTLRPSAELDAWGDAFRSNELGYRAAPTAKPPGTFRIVFVGDSWTYGMGVREEDSYPRVVERLANRHAGLEGPVEAWNLALPGYNTFNFLAALWYFFERLEPDAVVICPGGNDNHSTPAVLPNGAMASAAFERDRFGDPHAVTYRLRRLDSHRFRERWRMSFAALRDAERRLERLGVPVLLFFLARWEPPDVHARVAEAELESPYLIAPLELTLGEWENTPPFGHGTPAANRRYARMVYRGLERLLGWPALPAAEEPAAEGPTTEGPTAEELSALTVFDGPPAGDWGAAFDELSAEATAAAIPHSFRPSRSALAQTAGPIDTETGLIGRATTVLVRSRPGARALQVAVRRLPDAPSLYPLNLAASIPSPSGGTRVETTVPAEGPEVHRFPVAVPADLEPGAAFDVVLVAERAVAAPGSLQARSLYVESVEFLDAESVENLGAESVENLGGPDSSGE